MKAITQTKALLVSENLARYVKEHGHRLSAGKTQIYILEKTEGRRGPIEDSHTEWSSIVCQLEETSDLPLELRKLCVTQLYRRDIKNNWPVLDGVIYEECAYSCYEENPAIFSGDGVTHCNIIGTVLTAFSPIERSDYEARMTDIYNSIAKGVETA